MALLATSLTMMGRKNIKKVFLVEADSIDKQYLSVVGDAVDSTTQIYETYKQLAGLGPAQQMNDGDRADYDDETDLFMRNFTPVIFAKAKKYSKQMDFTNQYKSVLKAQPAFARAFLERRNIQGANLDNLGFTDTTMGMNSEVLYSTSHSMGNYTGANTDSLTLALSPKNLETALMEMRTQRSARNLPQRYIGQVVLKVPPQLEFLTLRILNSVKQQGTADNDSNEVKKRVSHVVIDYYSTMAASSITTTSTAWFLRAAERRAHGLFWLEQMPYDVEKLAMGDDFMIRWVACESFITGWFDWHGTWGTPGR